MYLKPERTADPPDWDASQMPPPQGTPATSPSAATARAAVELFQRLSGPEGAAVLATLPPYHEARTLATAESLRRAGVNIDLAAAALTQQRLRERARAKFGDRAGDLRFTAAGLEQATRSAVADRHAARFVAAGSQRVADLCCGIGGDLLALARAGVPALLGIDLDPLTAAVARTNVDARGGGICSSDIEVRCADVRETPLGEVDAVFVDPARRDARGRALDPNAWSPPYSMVLVLTETVPAVGAKLAPGIAHSMLPRNSEAEWVSDRGDVVECALWCGPLSTGVARRATLLPSGASLTGDGTRVGTVGPLGRYLVEPDGAVIRAGLVAEAADLLGGRLLDPTIAYVTTDANPVGSAGAPFGTAYEVLEVMPFSLKRLRTLLRARGVGKLTIKKRGTAVVPEELRTQLRLQGTGMATIVLTRIAGAQSVLLVEPMR